jgi:hypothetical protein
MLENKQMIPDDYVVVLGSGCSILDLPPDLIAWVNNTHRRVSINKFIGFYEKSKIIPTDVFFYDYKDKASREFLKFAFSRLIGKSSEGMIFYLARYYENYTYTSFILFKLYSLSYKIYNLFIRGINKLFVLLLNKFTDITYRKTIIKEFLVEIDRLILIPKRNSFIYISIQNWLSKKNTWASSLDQDLYHYRGSLSTVFNLVAIRYPNKKLLLLGVDMIGSEYFYEKELKDLSFSTDDWTTNSVKESKKHFSIINHKGTSIIDEFPQMIKKLALTGNMVYGYPENSYFVKGKYIKPFKWVGQQT